MQFFMGCEKRPSILSKPDPRCRCHRAEDSGTRVARRWCIPWIDSLLIYSTRDLGSADIRCGSAEATGSPAFLSWICWTSLHLFQPLQVCVEEAGLPRWCGLPQLPLLQMAAKTQGRGKWFHSSDCSSWWTLGSDVGQHPSSTGSYPDGTNFGDADATETWLQV